MTDIYDNKVMPYYIFVQRKVTPVKKTSVMLFWYVKRKKLVVKNILYCLCQQKGMAKSLITYNNSLLQSLYLEIHLF